MGETAPAVWRELNEWRVTWHPNVQVSLYEAACRLFSIQLLLPLTKHSPVHRNQSHLPANRPAVIMFPLALANAAASNIITPSH